MLEETTKFNRVFCMVIEWADEAFSDCKRQEMVFYEPPVEHLLSEETTATPPIITRERRNTDVDVEMGSEEALEELGESSDEDEMSEEDSESGEEEFYESGTKERSKDGKEADEGYKQEAVEEGMPFTRKTDSDSLAPVRSSFRARLSYFQSLSSGANTRQIIQKTRQSPEGEPTTTVSIPTQTMVPSSPTETLPNEVATLPLLPPLPPGQRKKPRKKPTATPPTTSPTPTAATTATVTSNSPTVSEKTDSGSEKDENNGREEESSGEASDKEKPSAVSVSELRYTYLPPRKQRRRCTL